MASKTKTTSKSKDTTKDKATPGICERIIGSISKKFGEGSLMRMGDGAIKEVATFPSGSIGLDIALGGGLPRGRIIEVYGHESSGKTTLTLQAIAEMQRLGGTAAFIDAEHALDPVYAEALGVDMDNLLISQPDCGEQALDITAALIDTGDVDLVVIDSVAALVPRAEIEGDMGDQQMGLQARLMSKAMRMLAQSASKRGASVIFINQVRQKIGVVFGNPEVTTGGNALKFYTTVRVEVRRTGSIKQGNDILGNRVKVKVTKNKIAPPFRQAEFDIMFGKGICRAGEVLDMAETQGLVDKSGSWYRYGGENIGQGREGAKAHLITTPSLLDDLAGRVRAHLAKVTAEAA